MQILHINGKHRYLRKIIHINVLNLTVYNFCFVVTDKLDGIRTFKRRPQIMEDYLGVTDDYELRHSEPGKKRVCIIVITVSSDYYKILLKWRTDMMWASFGRQATRRQQAVISRN